MRVSLSPQRPSASAPHRDAGSSSAPPLLALGGARVILGGHMGAQGLAEPVVPSAASLFGPRAAYLAGPAGPLFVSDTGHHRLLVWSRAPEADQTPADFVLGQPDFSREGRNAKAEANAATLNVPTGIAAADGVLAVADAWNHRILLWHGLPSRSNQPADIVLGQADFAGCLPNRGKELPGADTLNWCYGVALSEKRLLVADTGNRRILVWNTIPTSHGAPADLVLGQTDFVCRDENAGLEAGPVGMRWPHGIALAGGAVVLADAGNNRLMVWRRLPAVNGAPCDFVIGQADCQGLDHNRAAYYPTDASLNMPYGVAAFRGNTLVVADTANSRLLGFDSAGLGAGASAIQLTGQQDFTDKGDNRWGQPLRDSLCWPYGIAACGGTLVIADSGNNRVLLWEAAS